MPKSLSVSRSSVSKKSRPKIGTKSKVIKFHQYTGPKNLQQQLEPCASSSASAADTPFNILVQQQQMLLRWQLEMQQKNMQFLLSGPSNEPPKPVPPKPADSAPAASTNVSVKPSASTPVDPALAAKRSQLEEMKVPELKEECRRLNISRTGLKTVLIERLLPYADDILSGNTAAMSSEHQPVEQFDTSTSTSILNFSNNDASPDTNTMLSIQHSTRMMPAENATMLPAVPMDVDSVQCKQETKTPDIAQPPVYPMMFIPANNGGRVVQASVSSCDPPVIVLRPPAQRVITPVNAPGQFASMQPSLQEHLLLEQQRQEQLLLEQQRHINELQHHLQLSQRELIRAQQEAKLQRTLHTGVSPLWMNSAALNGSSMSASVSSANCHAQPSTTSQLIRTTR